MTGGQTIRVALKGAVGRFSIDAAFETADEGVTVLYGPSGCGKTSLLRAMAGLDRLEGTVWIAGQRWQDGAFFLPVYQRPIGYVFQEASLFAHRTVGANLRFGMPAATTAQVVSYEEVVDMLGLGNFIQRMPHTLSGGERQRVAIGRALLSQPRLLLMDEPLSALDTEARQEIMPFLERVRDRLKLPVIYITHNRDEVERLADRLVLMHNGRVTAAGALQDLQANPSLPLARMRDAAVSLEARISQQDNGLLWVYAGQERFFVPGNAAKRPESLRIRIAAADVSLAVQQPGASSIINILPGRIVSATAADNCEMLVVVALGKHGAGAHILSRISAYSWNRLGLAVGMPVYAQVKGVALIEG